MTEDIATRLRQFCDCTDRGKCFSCECAEEIERLRLHRDYWHDRCSNAEKCLDHIYKKKAWWKR